MQQLTTAVIYPAIGMMGAINVTVALGEGRALSLEEVRAKGRTVRARFDLAIEVPLSRLNGVWCGDVPRQHVPAAWRVSSDKLASL